MIKSVGHEIKNLQINNFIPWHISEIVHRHEGLYDEIYSVIILNHTEVVRKDCGDVWKSVRSGRSFVVVVVVVVFSGGVSGCLSTFLLKPVFPGAAIGRMVSMPLDFAAMGWKIAKMVGTTFPILGISNFVFPTAVGVRGFKVANKRRRLLLV